MAESKKQDNKDGSMYKLEKKAKNLKLALIGMVIITVVVLSVFITALRDNKINIMGASVIETKLSQDELEKNVYPQFLCSCCGKTIDDCSCGIAKEMKSYMDELADKKLSEKEIIMASVKKYGLTSLADKTLQEEIKEEFIKTAPKDRPKIVIEPSYYNFGDLSQSKGITSTVFTIKNEGKSSLIIDNMKSSCHCTTAAIIYNGIEGPKFGMHNNPRDWQVSIEPGEEAQLKVYYDPNAHGKFRGLVTRTVDIFSNDPIDFQIQIKI